MNKISRLAGALWRQFYAMPLAVVLCPRLRILAAFLALSDKNLLTYFSMKTFLISTFLLVAGVASVRACDTCGCEYCEPGALKDLAFGYETSATQSYFFASLAEQYTDYGTLKNVPVGASLNQFERSAITQFILGYQINDSLSVQVNLPYIYRWYRNMNFTGTASNSGQSDGFGDISVVANYIVLRKEAADWGYTWRVSGGVKLPTGDATPLDLESPTAAPSPMNSPFSAIGGHDIALGSGSVDGIIATGVNVNWQKTFFSADIDYAIRGTGRADYRYSNELSWSGGPGYRVFENDDLTVSLQLLATGEYKAADTIQGTTTDDTMVNSVSLGPKVLVNWAKHLTANFALELPVSQRYDPGFQALPTYRLKAGLSFRF